MVLNCYSLGTFLADIHRNEYKDKLNLWESKKNLTRTYVCDTILGRKIDSFKKERSNIYDRKSDKVRSTVGQVGEGTNNGRGKERTNNVSGQHDRGRISGGNAVRRGSSGISDGSGDNKRRRSVCKDTDGVHIRERYRNVHDAYGVEQNERLRASEGRGISNGNVQAGGFVHERTKDGEYAISEVS